MDRDAGNFGARLRWWRERRGLSQLALAGGTLWAAEIAARAGARAALVGGDAGAAARAALPSVLRAEAKVEGSGPVAVRVRVPLLLPGLPELALTAKSGLGDE